MIAYIDYLKSVKKKFPNHPEIDGINKKLDIEAQSAMNQAYLKLKATQNKSKDSTNPKDLIGIKKDNIHLVPPEAIRGISKAMQYGADKYGAYNWRDKKIQYLIYLDATLRHTLALLDGEDLDPDSGLPHIYHIGANAAILIDASKNDNLIDNRHKLISI
jgi:hypothetical protein